MFNPAVAALRRSMPAMNDGKGVVDNSGREVFCYAHPILWAPLSLVGGGWSAGS